MKTIYFKALPVKLTEAEKTGNIIKFDVPGGKDGYREFCRQNKIDKNTELEVEVGKFREKRTLNQNSLLHAICGVIAAATGMSKEWIKAGVKEQYGIKLEWRGLLIPKPTSQCNKAEMAMLIDGAIYEAADQGIDVKKWETEAERYKQDTVPDPGEAQTPKAEILKCAECGAEVGEPGWCENCDSMGPPKHKCLSCGYEYEGEKPERCANCGALSI